MNIKFLKQDLNKNLKLYNGDNSWLGTKYHLEDLFATYDKVKFEDFQLVESQGTKDDFTNMKIMYESLKGLTDSQASDERVWAGLAHTYCWSYMQVRWKLPEDESKQKNHILNNYFFWNSTKAPFLNGLSRLWWYARYTYDEKSENHYELTEYICNSDINGKIFPLLSCNFAVNKDVFVKIIKAIKKYEEKNKITLSREEFNNIKSYLNRLSGKIVIDILTDDEMYKYISSRINKDLSLNK